MYIQSSGDRKPAKHGRGRRSVPTLQHISDDCLETAQPCNDNEIACLRHCRPNPSLYQNCLARNNMQVVVAFAGTAIPALASLCTVLDWTSDHCCAGQTTIPQSPHIARKQQNKLPSHSIHTLLAKQKERTSQLTAASYEHHIPCLSRMGLHSTHPVGCQDLGGEGVPQCSKAPDLIGDVLCTHDRDVDEHPVIDEVQQLPIAHIQLG